MVFADKSRVAQINADRHRFCAVLLIKRYRIDQSVLIFGHDLRCLRPGEVQKPPSLTKLLKIILFHCDQVQRTGIYISHEISVVIIDPLGKRVKIAICIKIHVLFPGIISRIVNEVSPDLRLVARISLCIGDRDIEPVIIGSHSPCDNKIDHKCDQADNPDDPQLVIIPYILKLRCSLEPRNFPPCIFQFLMKILFHRHEFQ